MNLKHLLTGLTALFIASTWPLVAAAQVAFPDKPVRIIVPFSAGTGADIVARQLATQLGSQWNQQVIVDNRPGAGGITAMNAFKQYPADGHTVMLAEAGIVAIAPHIFKSLPYDSKADLAGVAPVFRTYYLMVVSSASPIDSYSGLVEAARRNPGKVSYVSTGIGSPAHLGGATLAREAGVDMLHVPYKDASQMYTDLASGNVTWVWATSGSLRPYLESRRLKVLASASPQRLRGFESLPTLAEAGGPKGLSVDNWMAVLARKGTPAETLRKLNEAISAAMATPEFQQRLNELGYDPFKGTAADAERLVSDELARYGMLVRQAGIERQ